MKRPDYVEMSHYVSRADGQPLTPEDVAAVDELLSLIVDFCEARGFHLNGLTGQRSEEDGEAEDLPEAGRPAGEEGPKT